MPTPRFLQIHTLHSYPAALLNRDDSGRAKRLPFGGAVRTRISSQCLKWHWRGKTSRADEGMTYEDREFALHTIKEATRAERTRNLVGRKIIHPLRDSDNVQENVLTAVENVFNTELYGESGTSERGRQPLLFGLPEIEYLRKKAATICEYHRNSREAAEELALGLLLTNEKIRKASGTTKARFREARKTAEKFFGNAEIENFEAFRKATKLPGGLEGALFGRMVTSDPAANIDAAIHVAHAFTVHREESESDYFSVVDDLQRRDEDAGAAHIDDTELTAGLFYGYVVVDVPGLVSNLEGCTANEWNTADTDRTMAAQVVHHLLHLIATVSPGAKLGSTAPYSCADLMPVEAGCRQPRSLANAFRKPVPPQTEAAVEALSGYLAKLDEAYGAKEARRVMSVEDYGIPEAKRVCLDDLAKWAQESIRNGKAEQACDTSS